MSDPRQDGGGKDISKTYELAMFSMVLGLGSIAMLVFCFCVMTLSLWSLFRFARLLIVLLIVFGILAVVYGHAARSNIRRIGRGLALAGLILGYFSLAGCFFAFFFLPSTICHSGSPRDACLNNLRQIDGAKEQWGEVNHKAETDTPTWKDLVGTYIKTSPVCKKGGVYSINDLAHPATCTIPGHELPR